MNVSVFDMESDLTTDSERKQTVLPKSFQPTAAFVGASWLALLIGACAYVIGLSNAQMPLNERGYYLTILLFGLFGAVSLQKSVRDRMEGIPVTNLYYGLSWLAVGLPILFLTIGLWNAALAWAEKGFFAMSFVLSLFATVAVQKNVRDLAASARDDESDPGV